MTNTEEQEQRAQIFVEQADRLINRLAIDASGVATRNATQTPWEKRPIVFRLAADAYDQLAFAQKTTDRVVWERTNEDGRSGDELMARLWGLLEEIRVQGS